MTYPSIKISPASLRAVLTLGGMPGPAGSPGPAAGANTITNVELADMLQNRIKGRVSAGSGDPQDLTAAQVKSMLGYLEAALNLSELTSIPTARSNLGLGAVATDSIVPVARGGHGASTVASAQAALGIGYIPLNWGTGTGASFWTTLDPAYKAFRIVLAKWEPSTSTATSYIRVSQDNRSTIYSSNTYQYTGVFSQSTGGGGYLSSTNNTSYQFTNGLNNTTLWGQQTTIDVVTGFGNNPWFNVDSGYVNSAGVIERVSGTCRVSGVVNPVTDVLIGISTGTAIYRYATFGLLNV